MEASEGVDARDLRVVLVVFFRAIRIASCSIAILWVRFLIACLYYAL